ncbi:RNA polymerase sigma factor [Spirosoma sordidisoli]|uniref:Sigma-70 family RNA polymerase sigma factor n=1 Tax=Spirosoma sordidisoli TaxID=2502893 RepID=A0A4Q2UKD1_9BACT|nr:sigma-70 family RNA polymerase sigma factor [Spirosoma sordidisoli]RYC69973.1 sigma-70 family RNA polymerase sigma factor [Spirosoma sordidisoli]
MSDSSAPSTLSDDALWEKLRTGDKQALGLLAERHYRALFHYGTKLTTNHALIQDCIQDLFLTVWEKQQTIPALHSVKAYLFVSLRNNVLRQVKQNGTSTDVDSDLVATDWLANPETLYVQAEHEQSLHESLRQALERLPKRQREAIYLRYYENLSYEEIATAMGLSRQVVANYLQHALHNLRDHWQDLSYALFLLSFLL